MDSSLCLGAYLPVLLAARGVDMVFGIPGVHTVEMYRGLPASGIRHVTPRHEQGAGFMADGYARVTGRPGVCFIITGPGMTNIATAMGQAYGDSIPMLVLSSVNARKQLGSGAGWLHELPNQSALIAGVAAFSRTIHHPAELEPVLEEAFALFASARPRPVHIEIPIDVLPLPIEPRGGAAAPQKRSIPIAPGQLATIAALLQAAQQPVILAGGGARHAKLCALAEHLDAPVVMTTNARGLLPPAHPLGVSLSASFARSRALIASADVVLAIGTELGPTDYDFLEAGAFHVPGTLVRIDIDPRQIDRNAPADFGLVADAGQTVLALLAAVPKQPARDGARRAATARLGLAELPEATQRDLRLLDLIRKTLPSTTIVGDSTQLVYSAIAGFAASKPGGFFASATGFGTLGYGLPAAIGAALGEDAPVVALTGDGGLQFCLGELAAAVEAKARVILVLHDNSGYGEIKTYMTARGITPVGVDIFTPDLCAIACACGWQVIKPTKEELPTALQTAAQNAGPTLLYIPERVRQTF